MPGYKAQDLTPPESRRIETAHCFKSSTDIIPIPAQTAPFGVETTK